MSIRHRGSSARCVEDAIQIIQSAPLPNFTTARLTGPVPVCTFVQSTMSSVPSLGDVPEEEALSPTSSHLDYSPESPTLPATSVLGGTAVRVSKKAPSIRTLGRSSSSSDAPVPPNSAKKSSSGSTVAKDARTQRAVSTITLKKTRSTPRMPHDKDAEPAPSTSMYWSRAPVYGTIPPKFMRGHSVTLVDATAWLFGGCDDKDLKENVRDMRIIYCFDTGSLFHFPFDVMF